MSRPVALPDKRLAVGKRRLGGQAGNRLDCPVGQAAEEWDAPQNVGRGHPVLLHRAPMTRR